MIAPGDRIAVWFSCGAASAVAAKLTLALYRDRCSVRVLNNPVAEEDEDNRRFLRDVEKWLRVPIEDVRNPEYSEASAVDVWDRRKAMSFPHGAPCTTELTKADCYDVVRVAGLRLPRIYEAGYPNANCIGCVKATSPTYWNLVREKHPHVFAQRAEQSRRLGVRLARVKNRRIFLDELSPDAKGAPLRNLAFECGVFCAEEGAPHEAD